MFPLNLYARVRLFSTSMARETAGAARIRLSLRPLTQEGVTLMAKLGHIAPRDREGVLLI